MKDKELRSLLEDAGIINEYNNEYGKYYVPICIGEKIDAIAKHLGLEFKRVPEKLIAVSKVAPQNTMEAANTSANNARDEIRALEMQIIHADEAGKPLPTAYIVKRLRELSPIA